MSALGKECGSGLIRLATRDALAIASECEAMTASKRKWRGTQRLKHSKIRAQNINRGTSDHPGYGASAPCHMSTCAAGGGYCLAAIQ